MSNRTYWPPRRCWRWRRDNAGVLGLMCQCEYIATSLPRMWLHKLARRHPFRKEVTAWKVSRVRVTWTWEGNR